MYVAQPIALFTLYPMQRFIVSVIFTDHVVLPIQAYIISIMYLWPKHQDWNLQGCIHETLETTAADLVNTIHLSSLNYAYFILCICLYNYWVCVPTLALCYTFFFEFDHTTGVYEQASQSETALTWIQQPNSPAGTCTRQGVLKATFPQPREENQPCSLEFDFHLQPNATGFCI